MTRLPYRRWFEVGILVSILFTLACFLIPAIQTARTTSRRVQSVSNLRNLVLSTHQFAVARQGGLPRGGVVTPDGQANCGWYFNLIPFIEAGSLYEKVLQHGGAWDNPAASPLLKSSMSITQTPLVGEVTTTDGWSLMHYSANPDLFYQNSAARMEDIDTHSNCWFFGEVSDHLVPWAYPFNWREAGESAGPPGTSFRNPTGTCQFAMADGRVVLVSAAASGALLRSSGQATASYRKKSEQENPFVRFVPPRSFTALRSWP